jgi:uncharacterized protein (DUF885 family)
MIDQDIRSDENIARANAAIERCWEELSATPYLALQDQNIAALPQIGPEMAASRTRCGEALLADLALIDTGSLPHNLALTVEVVRQRAQNWARDEEWYWVAFDPTGVGFYALFAPTSYAAGFLFGQINTVFRKFSFKSAADVQRYLSLATDYARLVGQITTRTQGQAERKIFMPRAQLAQSISLVRGVRDSIAATLAVSAERRTIEFGADFDSELNAAVEHIAGSFDALLHLIESETYAQEAPEQVGIGQYPGGAEIYTELVRLHTTLPLTPAEVHEIGLQRIATILQDMRALFDRVGHTGSAQDYMAAIALDPAWRAKGSDELSAFFRRYIDRIAPAIDNNFRIRAKADCDVAPLPEALCGSLTFGYYAPPDTTADKGLFFYNTVNLSNNALMNVAALCYHELVPGHHMHLSCQKENESLHPLRQNSFVNAYNEGWAEYAATLAGELGMYEQPEEQFGRYLMDAFLTCRLVVDTGMNALGWSLEDARTYMRESGFMPETEVQSESIRYSCDIPGQALAYKLGDTFIMEARERMRSALGDQFDIRDFHDAVLAPGGLPLPVLRHHLDVRTHELADAA